MWPLKHMIYPDLTGGEDKKQMNIQAGVYEDEDALEQTAALFKVREVSHCSLLFTPIKKNNNTFTHHKITVSNIRIKRY